MVENMTEDQIKAHSDEMFALVDTNKSGSLDWSEFIIYCKKFAPEMTEAEMKADWREMDLSVDGKVAPDELLKFIKKK